MQSLLINVVQLCIIRHSENCITNANGTGHRFPRYELCKVTIARLHIQNRFNKLSEQAIAIAILPKNCSNRVFSPRLFFADTESSSRDYRGLRKIIVISPPRQFFYLWNLRLAFYGIKSRNSLYTANVVLHYWHRAYF